MTTNVADAVSAPIDIVLNVAPVAPHELAMLTALVRAGGLVLSTTTPAEPVEARGVRGMNIYVRSDARQLRTLVAMVDAGELHVEVAERLPLAQLPQVHAQALAGTLQGKVVLLPAA